MNKLATTVITPRDMYSNLADRIDKLERLLQLLVGLQLVTMIAEQDAKG